MKYNFISFTDGSMEPTLNVQASVGYNGTNAPDDVLLIQGLIGVIAKLDKSWVGLDESGYAVPDVTGEMDADTYTAIGQFQIRNKDRLLMSTFDGRVDPAHYKNRHLPHALHRMMSITLLHQMATDASVLMGIPTDDPGDDLSYRGALVQLNPIFKGKINYARDMHVIEQTD
ncbi:MAG TPA: hypothetical protein VEV84_03940 [Pyrinomonadaceae bacterium]|nr:hypothetical protein [Pyrinomonadaceae bacterium]